MTLRLFNSLGNTLQEFRPQADDEVRMYNCGPTVYDYAHVGNMRAFLMADLLRRTLECRGYRVRQVMNITDVGHMTVDDARDTGEDKMALAVRRLQMDPFEVARFYEEAFLEDLRTLNFLPAESTLR